MVGLITEELNLKLQLTNKKNCKFNKLNLNQMKTIKPKLLLTFCVLMALALAFTSCKKNREFRNETASVTDDNKNVQAEMDGAVDDANKAISDNPSLGEECPVCHLPSPLRLVVLQLIPLKKVRAFLFLILMEQLYAILE